MEGGLGTFSRTMAGEPAMNAPATNPLVNPASMQPQAMSNLMGSPLQNGGANMMPYMQMQQAFMPKEQAGQASQSYNQGGLVCLADGGMAPPEQAMPPEQGAGGPPPQMPGGAGGEQAGGNPELIAEVEQIFQQFMQDPKALADALLELVKREISKSVSPEQMQQLQTPEGQAELKQIVEQLMSQMKGGLGGMAGGGGEGGEGGGMPPPTGAPAGPPPGAPQGGLAQMAGA
jgi:hypothetical protein